MISPVTWNIHQTFILAFKRCGNIFEMIWIVSSIYSNLKLFVDTVLVFVSKSWKLNISFCISCFKVIIT